MPPLSDDAVPFAGGLTPDTTSGRGPGILENSAINLAGLVAASVLGAVSGFITARVLGPTGVGVLAVVFGIVEFGRGLTNFTHTPSILEVHRGKDEGTVFGTSLVLKYVGALLFLLIAGAAAPWLAGVFDVPAPAIFLTATLLVVGAFQEIGTARYEAINQMRTRNVLVTLGPFVGLLAVLVYVALGKYDVYTAITTSLIGTAAMSLAFHLHWRHRRFRWDAGVAKYLIEYGGRLVIAGFLTQVLLWTDTLMVSALLGNDEAGVYHVVFQLVFVMVTASVAIGVALLPAMSELVGRGHDTTDAYQRGTLLALVLSVAMGIVYVAAGPFILSLYGPRFETGYLPLLVLTLFGAAAALTVPATSLLTVHGRAGTLMHLSLAQAALNVPVCFFLTKRYGIPGAATATTVIFLVGVAITWVLAYRETGATPLSRRALREAWERLRVVMRT